MNLQPIFFIAAALVALTVFAVFVLIWRSRRRAGERLAERERGELEARVAARVRSISEPGELEGTRDLPVTTRSHAEPIADTRGGEHAVIQGGTEPTPETAPSRMVPIAAPDIDRIYAPRRPQPTEPPPAPATRHVTPPATTSSPAAMEVRQPVTAASVRRTSRGPAEARRRRGRILVPAAAAVLVLVLAVIAGGPLLRALGGGIGVSPVGTQLGAPPSATSASTVAPAATPSSSPEATPNASPEPTPTAPPGGTPFPTPHVYVVRSGDTLWQIAMRFGIALDQLVAANPQIEDPNVILPGDQVTIPTPKPAP